MNPRVLIVERDGIASVQDSKSLDKFNLDILRREGSPILLQLLIIDNDSVVLDYPSQHILHVHLFFLVNDAKSTLYLLSDELLPEQLGLFGSTDQKV